MNRQCSTGTTAGLSLLGGAVAGALAMYLLDPEAGEHRRHSLGGTASGAARATGGALSSAWDTVSEKARHLGYGIADTASNVRHSDAVSGLGERLSGWGHSLVEGARGLGRGASRGASSAYESSRDAVSAGYSKAGSWFGHEEEDDGHALAYTMVGVATLAMGAGLMWLLDANQGRRRRAMLQDQVVSVWNRTGRTFSRLGRDLRNRASGYAHETRGFFVHEDAVSADQLLHRVRSEIGHVVSRPADIQVMTDNNGRVTLHGRVLASESDKMLTTVRKVGGVTEVVNLLSVDATPPAAAGTGATSGAAPQM